MHFFFSVVKLQKNKQSAQIFSKYLLRLISKESDSNNNLSSQEHLKKIKIKYIIAIIIIISYHHHHLIRGHIYRKRLSHQSIHYFKLSEGVAPKITEKQVTLFFFWQKTYPTFYFFSLSCLFCVYETKTSSFGHQPPGKTQVPPVKVNICAGLFKAKLT